MILAMPIGLLKDELMAPGRVVDEDALVSPTSIFEIDMILEDEFARALYPAGFKSDVVMVDFSTDVLSFLRDYNPVTASIEEVQCSHYPLYN